MQSRGDLTELFASAEGLLDLCDPTYFKALKVSVPVTMSASEVAVALLPLGQVGDGQAWLDIRALAALGLAGPSWREGFDAMIRYAGRSGWVSSDGMSVRAHIGQYIA